MSGAVSLQVETQTCNVNYGEIVQVLGNPDGAVPDSPDDYETPQVADVQIVGYNGEFDVLDARTLFLAAPALAESNEQVGSDSVAAWAIDEQDVDYAIWLQCPPTTSSLWSWIIFRPTSTWFFISSAVIRWVRSPSVAMPK